MKKVALPSILVAVVLLTLRVTAEAQQQRKIPRIGYPGYKHCSLGSAVLVDAFRQEIASLDGLRERISPSSTDLRRKRLSACPSLRRTWFVLRLI